MHTVRVICKYQLFPIDQELPVRLFLTGSLRRHSHLSRRKGPGTKDPYKPYSALGFLRCCHNAACAFHQAQGVHMGSEHYTALPAR